MTFLQACVRHIKTLHGGFKISPYVIFYFSLKKSLKPYFLSWGRSNSCLTMEYGIRNTVCLLRLIIKSIMAFSSLSSVTLTGGSYLPCFHGIQSASWRCHNGEELSLPASICVKQPCGTDSSSTRKGFRYCSSSQCLTYELEPD